MKWKGGYLRIIAFWAIGLGMTACVVAVIALDIIDWDRISSMFPSTNELARSFLASFIVSLDLLQIMQVSYVHNFFRLPPWKWVDFRFLARRWRGVIRHYQYYCHGNRKGSTLLNERRTAKIPAEFDWIPLNPRRLDSEKKIKVA